MMQTEAGRLAEGKAHGERWLLHAFLARTEYFGSIIFQVFNVFSDRREDRKRQASERNRTPDGRVKWSICRDGFGALSNAPQNKVTIFSKRHSGNLPAGIQKNSLDTGLRRYDELTVDSYLC